MKLLFRTKQRTSSDMKTLNIKVNGDAATIDRFMRFLWMIQRAGNVGHSGLFAMSVDGDGSEFINIAGVEYPDNIGEGYDNVDGADVEIAREDGFGKLYRRQEE